MRKAINGVSRCFHLQAIALFHKQGVERLFSALVRYLGNDQGWPEMRARCGEVGEKRFIFSALYVDLQSVDAGKSCLICNLRKWADGNAD